MVKIGQRFGKLVVLEKFREEGGRHYFVKCQCDCGNIITKRVDWLNDKSSCGCETIKLRVEGLKTHGMSKTKLYKVWNTMKSRCFRKKDKRYSNYGGRGISVCKEWEKFEPFYQWAISNGYKEGLTIERINVNGNYEPKNCKWITLKEQALNTTQNHVITYKGETHCLIEWVKILGFISYPTLSSRLRNGWNVEDAFTTPLMNRGVRCKML